MIRILKFLAAVILAVSTLAELGWITITHPWLVKAHALVLKAITAVLYLFF
jgi:hypothetical protein